MELPLPVEPLAVSPPKALPSGVLAPSAGTEVPLTPKSRLRIASYPPLCPVFFGRVSTKPLMADDVYITHVKPRVIATPLSERGLRIWALISRYKTSLGLGSMLPPYPPEMSINFKMNEAELKHGLACAQELYFRDRVTTAGFNLALPDAETRALFATAPEACRYFYAVYRLFCGGATCTGRCKEGQCWL